MRRELFEKVGWLDERFESYLEDVDFSLRSARKGCLGVYVPEAVAYHQGSATLGAWHPETARRIARNQLLLVAKHYPRGWLFRYGWPVLVDTFSYTRAGTAWINHSWLGEVILALVYRFGGWIGLSGLVALLAFGGCVHQVKSCSLT